jgi:hypothetical protein
VTSTTRSQGFLIDSTTVALTGPFELSSLRPDTIEIIETATSGHRRLTLNMPSIKPLPVTSKSTAVGNYGSGPTSTSSSTYSISSLALVFATQDIANRQAKAWHDAIIGCGGKPVSLLFCTVTAISRASAQTSTAAPPARQVLVIHSTPGGVQVYVDDELMGTTSHEGRLKISTLKISADTENQRFCLCFQGARRIPPSPPDNQGTDKFCCVVLGILGNAASRLAIT